MGHQGCFIVDLMMPRTVSFLFPNDSAMVFDQDIR